MQSHVLKLCTISYLLFACCLLVHNGVGLEVIQFSFFACFFVMVKYRNLNPHTLPPPRFTTSCQQGKRGVHYTVMLMICYSCLLFSWSVTHIAVLSSQIWSNILFIRLVHNWWQIFFFLLCFHHQQINITSVKCNFSPIVIYFSMDFADSGY